VVDKLEIRQLRFAVRAADAHSFARAAAELNVKQSTLSRCVMDMEIRLGVKLFERTTRGAVVTENGRVFIEQARRIITDVDNLQTTARNVRYGLEGRLSVGHCSSLLSGNLKLAYTDYLTRFPEVQFDGIEAGPEKLIYGLQSQTMDVVIAPIGLNENGVCTKRLWSERLFVALHCQSELVNKDRIYWHDLRREVFVVPENGLGPLIGNLISARLTEQAYRPAVMYQDTSYESVLSMIAARRFISVATEASQGIAWPDLEFCEIYDANGPARLEYALYWRADNDNPALKRFFKLIEERYPG
jgi:DNA-binding transcriptional LysR family regulator